MPLQLLVPPVLVSVLDLDGCVRPALLLGRRDERRFVQVSHGAGDNRLRWVAAFDVGVTSPVEPAPVSPGGPVLHPSSVPAGRARLHTS